MTKIFYLLLFTLCLQGSVQAQGESSKPRQSSDQVEQFIKEAHEKRRRITVQANLLAYERVGAECVLVEKIRKVSGIVTDFSEGQSFTISECRGFAPFLDNDEGGGFNATYTICLSKVIAVKKQNQILRVLRDAGETAGFIGFSAAALPTLPVILVLARAGKIDW